jgi:hypothetical protein
MVPMSAVLLQTDCLNPWRQFWQPLLACLTPLV